jgi:hypothetical protein
VLIHKQVAVLLIRATVQPLQLALHSQTRFIKVSQSTVLKFVFDYQFTFLEPLTDLAVGSRQAGWVDSIAKQVGKQKAYFPKRHLAGVAQKHA